MPKKVANSKAAKKNNKKKTVRQDNKTKQPKAELMPTPPQPPKRQNKGVPGVGIRKTKLKFSTDGKRYIYKAINPCHSDGQNCAGVPNAVAEETCVVCARVDTTVNCPLEMSKLWNYQNASSDWFVGFVIPPWFDDCVLIIASAFQITKFDSIAALVNNSLEYPNWKSTTDAPTLVDGVWFCKITNPMFRTRAEIIAAGVEDYSNIRLIGRGLTLDLISDALNDRGSVTASQFNAPPSSINVNQSSGSGADMKLVSSVSGTQILFGQVSPKNITAADDRAYTNKAKYGCYMPVYMNVHDHLMLPGAHRPIVPSATTNTDGAININDNAISREFKIQVTTHDITTKVIITNDLGAVVLQESVTIDHSQSVFTDSKIDLTNIGIPTDTTVKISMFIDDAGDDGNSLNWFPFTVSKDHFWFRNNDSVSYTTVNISPASTTAPTTITGYFLDSFAAPIVFNSAIVTENPLAHKVYNPGQNTGIIWFQAISGASSIKVKGRMHCEAEAQSGSYWSGFNQAGACEDPKAITFVASLSHRLPHAFPASANNRGVLSELLAKLVSKIPLIGDLLSNLF
uniref:Capsid protein n=1 Tax=Avian associated hepe-like virus 10 TaxID=2996224 RepID=A0A9E9FUN8_9VIRU|nr:MAG: capsid protein [Avian associated hepe-like virus 10]